MNRTAALGVSFFVAAAVATPANEFPNPSAAAALSRE